jgi:hypothetical protein
MTKAVLAGLKLLLLFQPGHGLLIVSFEVIPKGGRNSQNPCKLHSGIGSDSGLSLYDFINRFLGPACAPRGAPQMHVPVASPQVPGLIISGSLATPTLCNEAEPGSLALGLAPSLSREFLSPSPLRPRPRDRPTSRFRLPSTGGCNYMSNEQLTCMALYSHIDQPGLSWRTRERREE